jgi:cell division septation protein DedD
MFCTNSKAKLFISLLMVLSLFVLPLQMAAAEETALQLNLVEITNKGDVSLTFDKEMADPSGTQGQFKVKADDVEIPVTKVEKTDTPEKIKLVLETKVSDAKLVVVSYVKSDDPALQVKAVDGSAAESFDEIEAISKDDGSKKGDGQGENNGESVAIIGGADGPTEIVIAEEEEDKNEEQQPEEQQPEEQQPEEQQPEEQQPEEQQPEDTPKEVKFQDIENHWAKDDIVLLASKSIVDGIGNGNFDPEGKVTRAQFAAMLTRALNLSEGEQKVNFSDVKDEDWFVNVVNAAFEAGIIKGYDDGSFKPNEPISRQEVAVMINRSLNVIGQKPEVEDVESLIAKFTDKDKIASWAQKPVATAVQVGIIQGMTDGSFAPTENCTRAQAVVMIKRLLEKGNLL